MKSRVILTAIAWLLCMGHAFADNYVIENVTVPQGGSTELVIGYNFTSESSKVGFTFALNLPAGLSLEKDTEGDLVCVKDACIEKLNIISASDTNVESIGGQPSSESATIKGTSGTLLTLNLQASSDLEIGKDYTVTVTKATFQQKVDGTITDIILDDFTFTVTIDEPDDGYIKFDEKATKLPKYTAGGKGNVRMTRTIKANEWSTLVLPFALSRTNAQAAFGSDVKFATFEGFEVDYGDDLDNLKPLGITVNFKDYEIPARGNLAGGTPVLIKTSTDITSFEFEGVTLADEITAVSKNDEYGTAGKFAATFVKSVVPADGLFLNDNLFWYSTGNTNIKAFRGWFELGAVLGKDTDFNVKMNFLVDGEETRINGLNSDAEDTIYDLGGRKINKPQQRGVYIVNGKKVAIK